jgi:hypothetical protein
MISNARGADVTAVRRAINEPVSVIVMRNGHIALRKESFGLVAESRSPSHYIMTSVC